MHHEPRRQTDALDRQRRFSQPPEHHLEGNNRDVTTGLMDGRQRHGNQGGIFDIIKTHHPDVPRRMHALQFHGANEHRSGVVVGADDGVGQAACHQ